MKINKQIYNSITSTPFDVQELKNGGKIELHSLNDNESLYNQYAPQAKFAVWSSVDGVNYRLLLEDGYYAVMKEIYSRRVNQRWLDFWDEYDAGRKRTFKFYNVPALALALLAALFLIIFSKKLAAAGQSGSIIQWVVLGVAVVGFLGVTFVSNRRLDRLINESNNRALEDIKNIVGHDHFDELMEAQQAYYDEFFGLNNQEEEQPEEPAEEKALEPEALEEPQEQKEE